MIILHVYSEKRLEGQKETQDYVASSKYDIVSRKTTIADPASYWNVLMEYWGRDDLIHFQQDVVPTDKQIEALVSCPYLACTYPHKLQTAEGLWYPSYTPDSAAKFMPSAVNWYYPPYPFLVECSGMALVKLTKQMQNMIDLANYSAPGQHWSMIDTWISCYMDIALRHQWHVHTPAVKHNHF